MANTASIFETYYPHLLLVACFDTSNKIRCHKAFLNKTDCSFPLRAETKNRLGMLGISTPIAYFIFAQVKHQNTY